MTSTDGAVWWPTPSATIAQPAEQESASGLLRPVSSFGAAGGIEEPGGVRSRKREGRNLPEKDEGIDPGRAGKPFIMQEQVTDEGW